MSPLWAEPRTLDVDTDDGRPLRLRFGWEQRHHEVAALNRHWRVHLDWWTSCELRRSYWEIVTDSGLLCVIYHDLIVGGWFLERIYP